MVKIGIMSFAHMHATSYAGVLNELPNAELTGIADHDSQRAAAMAEKFGTKVFPSYDALLESDIDGVVITSENSMHKELTTMAAKAGKHVLCEKPISTTIEDGQAMIDVCRDNGVQLMTAFPCRFCASIMRLKELADSGELGEILAIKGANRGKMPGGWFIEADKSGGGAVIDHTVHVADIMRWITRSEPVKVYAEISNAMHHGDYDDCGMLNIEFANGVYATLDTSWSRPKSYPTWGDVLMQVVGSKGMADMDMFAQNVEVYSDKDMSATWMNWGDASDYAMISDFVQCLEDKTPVKVTGEDGLQAVAVALAAYRSARLGEPVGL